MPGHEEVLTRAMPAVAESLSIDTDEVQPSQTYFVDLGGDSIAWLDLSFRLDREFGVRVPTLNSFGAVGTDAEGRFTAAGIEALKAIMPASLLERVTEEITAPAAKDLLVAITVDDIAGMVEMAIASKNAIAST